MNIKRTITPRLSEIIVYIVLSVSLIVFFEYENLIRWLTGHEVGGEDISDAINQAFTVRFQDFLQLLDSNSLTGSLVISIFWAGLGVATYMIVSAAQRYFVEAEEDLLSEAKYVHPRDYSHKYFWVLFVARILYRSSMVAALVLYSVISVQVLLPMWFDVIENWVTSPGLGEGSIGASLAFVGLVFTWHVIVVLARLLFLRDRVFSDA